MAKIKEGRDSDKPSKEKLSSDGKERRPKAKIAKRRSKNRVAPSTSTRKSQEVTYEPTVRDLVAIHAVEMAIRASRLTRQDVANAGAMYESSSSSENEEADEKAVQKYGACACCGTSTKHDIDGKFDDKSFRAGFMSKTMLIMAAGLLFPLGWNTYYLSNESIRIYFIDGILLNSFLSGICTLGLNVAIRKMQQRSGVMLMTVYVLRSLALAFTITALTSGTELLLIHYAFEAPYVHIQDPTQDEHKLSLSIKAGIAINITTTPQPHTATHISQKYVHSLPVFWIIICYVIFLSWTMIGVVLRMLNVNKTEPSGIWMFGIGCTLAFASSILTFIVLLLLDYGKGPRLWDLAQVFVIGIVTVVEEILLPLRWKRLFEGKVLRLRESSDCVAVAGRFSI